HPQAPRRVAARGTAGPGGLRHEGRNRGRFRAAPVSRCRRRVVREGTACANVLGSPRFACAVPTPVTLLTARHPTGPVVCPLCRFFRSWVGAWPVTIE